MVGVVVLCGLVDGFVCSVFGLILFWICRIEGFEGGMDSGVGFWRVVWLG